ncbi:MAG: Coenzyme F420 hydrogenase/dehydrogenase, beta subunit C-terminal domain [Clostridia bacterium]|nr:Coenzyme F420 hydrogenase/dehydrogenase, beta subunit C-terminal domain [Clostridia bacterium]
MDILAQINKELCNGCAACVNICPCGAIQMKTDELGFVYPDINDAVCVQCGKCVTACNATQEMVLNAPVKAFAAAHREKAVLCASASGGVFSAVAEQVLEQGGAVCGCVYDDDLKPIHICAEKKEDYLRMRRSKYLQSDVGLVYQEIKKRLKNGQTVFFSGTPCQVAALYAVVGRQTTNLITADLICHGVPGYEMFKRFIRYLENKYQTEITDFNFRSKQYGWQRFTAEFTDANGRKQNIGKVEEFYLAAFTAGNIMRPSCFSCRFATDRRIGDITLGDFWGYEVVDLPFNVTKGNSVCLLNTSRGMALLPFLSERMYVKEIDCNVAVAGNTCLRHPTPKGEKWEMYMQAFKDNEIDRVALQYCARNKRRVWKERLKLWIPGRLFVYLKRRQKRR